LLNDLSQINKTLYFKKVGIMEYVPRVQPTSKQFPEIKYPENGFPNLSIGTFRRVFEQRDNCGQQCDSRLIALLAYNGKESASDPSSWHQWSSNTRSKVSEFGIFCARYTAFPQIQRDVRVTVENFEVLNDQERNWVTISDMTKQEAYIYKGSLLNFTEILTTTCQEIDKAAAEANKKKYDPSEIEPAVKSANQEIINGKRNHQFVRKKRHLQPLPNGVPMWLALIRHAK
jgi:hypothetical protein